MPVDRFSGFCYLWCGDRRALHSFPTRRSSDLVDASALARARFRKAAISLAALPRAELYSRSEEHTSELQSQFHLVCRLLLEKKKCPGKRRNLRTALRAQTAMAAIAA